MTPKDPLFPEPQEPEQFEEATPQEIDPKDKDKVETKIENFYDFLYGHHLQEAISIQEYIQQLTSEGFISIPSENEIADFVNKCYPNVINVPQDPTTEYAKEALTKLLYCYFARLGIAKSFGTNVESEAILQSLKDYPQFIANLAPKTYLKGSPLPAWTNRGFPKAFMEMNLFYRAASGISILLKDETTLQLVNALIALSKQINSTPTDSREKYQEFSKIIYPYQRYFASIDKLNLYSVFAQTRQRLYQEVDIKDLTSSITSPETRLCLSEMWKDQKSGLTLSFEEGLIPKNRIKQIETKTDINQSTLAIYLIEQLGIETFERQHETKQMLDSFLTSVNNIPDYSEEEKDKIFQLAFKHSFHFLMIGLKEIETTDNTNIELANMFINFKYLFSVDLAHNTNIELSPLTHFNEELEKRLKTVVHYLEENHPTFDQALSFTQIILNPVSTVISISSKSNPLGKNETLSPETSPEIIKALAQIQQSIDANGGNKEEVKKVFSPEFPEKILKKLQQSGGLEAYVNFFKNPKARSEEKKSNSLSLGYLINEQTIKHFVEFETNLDTILQLLTNKLFFDEFNRLRKPLKQFILAAPENVKLLNKIIEIDDNKLQLKALKKILESEIVLSKNATQTITQNNFEKEETTKLFEALTSPSLAKDEFDFVFATASSVDKATFHQVLTYLREKGLRDFQNFISQKYKFPQKTIANFENSLTAICPSENLPSTLEELIIHPFKFQIIKAFIDLNGEFSQVQNNNHKIEGATNGSTDPNFWQSLRSCQEIGSSHEDFDISRILSDLCFLELEEYEQTIQFIGNLPLKGLNGFLNKGLHILAAGLVRHKKIDDLTREIEKEATEINLQKIEATIEKYANDLPPYLHAIQFLVKNSKRFEEIRKKFQDEKIDIEPGIALTFLQNDQITESQVESGIEAFNFINELAATDDSETLILIKRCYEKRNVNLVALAAKWHKNPSQKKLIPKLLQTLSDEEIAGLTEEEIEIFL